MAHLFLWRLYRHVELSSHPARYAAKASNIGGLIQDMLIFLDQFNVAQFFTLS